MQNNNASINFESLMSGRVARILLISSSYDQFTLEEDGRIEQQIQTEYAELSLTSPPRFVRVENATDAIKELDRRAYDLIISMFNIGEMSPFELAVIVKKSHPNIPFVLLTSFSHEISRRLSTEDTSGIDYVFSWQGNADLILSIIKMIEDQRNADVDILQYGVQAILLVEDSIRFYSAYLPDLYKIVLTQTNIALAEALNEQQRKVRKRARPKILFARTYQEAIEMYEKYGSNLLGVISDVSYAHNRGDKTIELLAGVRLCEHIRKKDSRIPLVLQSSEIAMCENAASVHAEFIYKHSKTLFDELELFINEKLAFGAFRFINPSTGEVLAVAEDLAGLQAAIETLPDDVLLHYSGQNMFSKWLRARGLFDLADQIREMFVDNFDDGVAGLRSYLTTVVRRHRRAMGQGVVAEFNTSTYNRYITFARCGTGSLGGKARGLAFVGSMIEQHNLYAAWEDVRVTIPRTLAVSTGYFEEFMADNGLHYIASEATSMSDSEILAEFIGARLPEKLLAEVRVFLGEIERPLAIRSSSKLEDSHYQPFAGIYSTYMIPRTDNIDQEVRLTAKAIKSVYASVFFATSRAYIESTSNVIGEESMGVVIQEISGTEQDGYLFPTISGVARSLNYYPIGDEKPEEGVCDIAFGLGKAVVEGGTCLRFSPAHPRHTLQLSTMESTLRDTQRYFYALDLNPTRFRTSADDGVNITKIEVSEASKFRNLRYVASTWDFQNERISDSYNGTGRALITFASILKYNTFPLAEIVGHLLSIGEREMKSPVEIEFAVNLDVPHGEPTIFNFLQIRPMASTARSSSLDWTTVDHRDSLIYAERALGIGAIEGVTEIIYVKTDNFNASNNNKIAQQIGEINEVMKAENRNYILVGPGRWGSSDHWLGIPVKWGQISQSRVIVECGLENYRIDPSQGTHFFQNLTSFGVGYLTINPFIEDGVFDISSLDAMEATSQTEYLRVVRFAKPLYIFVDGRNSRAIIRPDKG